MERFKKKMGLLVSKVDGKFYVCYDYEVFEINEVGARIIELCDGKNCISDISEKLSKKFDVDKAIVEKDVENYITLLLSTGIIDKID